MSSNHRVRVVVVDKNTDKDSSVLLLLNLKVN